MRKLLPKKLTAALVVAVSFALPAAAQEPSGPILFTNVNVFDGVNADLIKNVNVVVTGNKITSVSKEPLAVAGGTVIDGGGRTLMPGLTDCHWHNMAAYMGADVFTAGLGKLVISDTVDVIVISGLVEAYDDSQASPHGIAIHEYDVIGVKSGNLFRGFY